MWPHKKKNQFECGEHNWVFGHYMRKRCIILNRVLIHNLNLENYFFVEIKYRRTRSHKTPQRCKKFFLFLNKFYRAFALACCVCSSSSSSSALFVFIFCLLCCCFWLLFTYFCPVILITNKYTISYEFMYIVHSGNGGEPLLSLATAITHSFILI